MPILSDQQLARVQNFVSSTQVRLAKAREKAEEKAGEVKQTAETVGAAGVIGFVRGKMEAPDGSFNIPGTTIDIELAAGIALVGAAYFDAFGKYDEDALNAGNGVLAHYVGQIGRKFAKSGVPLIAGGPTGWIGSGGELSNALAAF